MADSPPRVSDSAWGVDGWTPPIVVLDACVLYMKKDMMIATKGTSCAIIAKQKKNSRIMMGAM